MNNNISITRKNFEKLGANYPPADKVIVEKEVIENVDCYWFTADGVANTNKLAIHLHGGCFALGSIHSHRSLVSHISEQISLPVLFIEYGLAPEHPYPWAVNEVVLVYKHLLDRHPEREIVFMGDSAGAGLMLSVLSKLNKEHIPRPAYFIMLSPWLDLSCGNQSITQNAAHDPVLTKEALLNYTSLYVANNLPEANPMETIYGKFPPTLILVGSGEILLDDSKNIYNMIRSLESKTKLSIYEKQNHVWMLENIHSEESKEALKEIKEFITD